MNIKRGSLVLLITCSVLLGACKSTEVAQEPKSMEDELIEKHLTARGGLENIRAVESMTWNGNVSVMGMDLPLTIYMKRPNKMRSEVLVLQMNIEIITGFDGETAWAINPMISSAPQKMPDTQTRLTQDQADMDGPLVDYKEKGYTVEYMGEEDVRGTNAHKLKISRPERADAFVYLDAETFLIVKAEGEGVDPQTGGMVQTRTYTSDYREVNGLMVAHAIEVESPQMTQKIQLESVKVNADIDDALFAFPQQ
ncbi:MAG: hypothetical protein ACE5G0_19130 [Rhodothermales bacterium]